MAEFQFIIIPNYEKEIGYWIVFQWKLKETQKTIKIFENEETSLKEAKEKLISPGLNRSYRPIP